MASLLRCSPGAANDNRVQGADSVAGVLAIGHRLLLGAGGIGIIAAAARILGLGQAGPY